MQFAAGEERCGGFIGLTFHRILPLSHDSRPYGGCRAKRSNGTNMWNFYIRALMRAWASFRASKPPPGCRRSSRRLREVQLGQAVLAAEFARRRIGRY